MFGSLGACVWAFMDQMHVTYLCEMQNEGSLLPSDVSSLLEPMYIPFFLGCRDRSPGILNMGKCGQPPPTKCTFHVT